MPPSKLYKSFVINDISRIKGLRLTDRSSQRIFLFFSRRVFDYFVLSFLIGRIITFILIIFQQLHQSWAVSCILSTIPDTEVKPKTLDQFHTFIMADFFPKFIGVFGFLTTFRWIGLFRAASGVSITVALGD